MASKSPGIDVVIESCDPCGRETSHDVRVELRVESPDAAAETAAFSREPYRVTECQVCGSTRSQRMNNA